MDRKYVAFISYRHAEMDSAIAKTIHTLIEQYRIPKGLRKNGKSRQPLWRRTRLLQNYRHTQIKNN